VLATGDEGRRLDAVQADAIKEVLAWLHAQHHRRRPAPTPPSTAE
jgi:hypothetical protein